MFLSHLGNKAQVTLPKAVRQALGLKVKEDVVGFIVEGNRVAVTRVEPLPSSDPFTDEEWKKIRKLAARGPVSGFSGSKESLKELKAWLRLP
ncbi:MAG: AbrB/MazE/SpoVT family DNA-binding domain-containing protein [Elusimicrobia bacterium]|nr:AbrB/MazE/SpoVT family DNA-binding domain-containing protein [Elusimicrobiota bacterium]